MAETTTTTRRLQTGVPGLDPLLGGGLLEGRTVLLKGAPGSGKTTLGLQMLMAGAQLFEEPGILLTFEQVPEQLYADAASLGWDLKALVDKGQLQIQFINPEDVLEVPSRQEHRLLANICDWVEDFGSRRILIDSISHLHQLFAGEAARALMMSFLVQLKSMGLTPLLTAELKANEGLTSLDAYLVDTVLNLTYHSGGVGKPARRELEILKTRGQRHVGGAHPFEIGAQGITIYPHVYPPAEQPAARRAPEPLIATGVTGLDPLLGGGYAPGSAILVAGLSGTFKTTLAAHFLLGESGAANEQPGLWITFQESAEELLHGLASPELNLAAAHAAERIAILEKVPGAEPIEKILFEAEALIRERGIRRVVLDSMNELTFGASDEADRQEEAHWFLHRLRRLGVTTLFTQRLTRVTGRNPLSEISGAEQADTIIYLGLVEIESRLEKVISVLKHRGGPTGGDLRSINYTARGLRVSDRFVGMSGVLAGTPLGRPKARIEEIFQPLYFIRDFLLLAKDPALAAEQRAGLLENLSSETDQLIDMLGRYFDQPLAKTGETNPASKEPKP